MKPMAAVSTVCACWVFVYWYAVVLYKNVCCMMIHNETYVFQLRLNVVCIVFL